jgi:hypothetical protein
MATKALAKGDDKGVDKANSLAGAGKFVATLAVVAGSVMALVKLFQFIEGTVIKANEEILKTAGIVDLVSAGAGSTSENLKLVRDTFRDADFANEMGMAYDETLALVGQFNQLNMGIKQFGGGEKGMERMKDAMKATKGMAYGLGISMEEAQGYMARFTHDLGVSAKDGSIIARMAGDFADIRDMALQSSYSTANFFKKVTELTGQLDNMNYRTKEAGNLVLRFASVLGKSGLDKALQSLFSGFRGEGYLEQMKRNMMSKSDEVKKALRVEAIKFGKSFQASFGGADGKGGMNEKLMKKFKLKEGDQKGLIAALAKLDNKGRQDLFTEMKEKGGKDATGEFTDQLYKLIRLSRGTKDKATSAEVQGAQEEMGAGGNLKTKFAMLENRIGDKDVNDLGVLAKKSLEPFGIGKEQLEVFGQLQTTMKGDLRKAQGIAGVVKKGGKLSDKEDIFLKSQGLGVDEKGNLIMSETKEAVNNFSDYLQAQDEAKFKGLEAHKKKTQEQFLDEGVKATTSVFNVLNNTIAGILNDISKGIYTVVQGIFGGEMGADEKKAQKEALSELTGKLENLEGLTKSASDKERELKRQVDSDAFRKKEKGLTQAERDAMAQREKDLAQATKDKEALKVKGGRIRSTMKDIQVNALEYDTADKDQLIKKAQENAVRDRVKRGKSGGELGAFKKEERDDLKGLEDLGIKTYVDLQKYLIGGGKDERVRERMAEKDLAFKQTKRGGEKRKGEGLLASYNTETTDSVLSKGGEKVAGSKRYFQKKWLGDTDITHTSSKEEELVVKAVKELGVPLPRSKQKIQNEQTMKDQEKARIDQGAKAFLKAQKEMKEDQIKAVADALGMKGSRRAQDIARVFKRGVSEQQKEKLSGLSFGGNRAAQTLLGSTPTKLEDFWLDGRGNLWKIDPQDLPTPMGGGLAMTKPKGAVDGYIDNKLKGSGSGQNITININEANNAEETGRVVMSKLRQANATVSGGMR